MFNCHENSDIFNHSISYNHPVMLEYFKILCQCNEYDLRVLESIYINTEKLILNDQASS